MRRPRRAALVRVLAAELAVLVLTACSVSTPRDGLSQRAAGGRAGGTDQAGQLGAGGQSTAGPGSGAAATAPGEGAPAAGPATGPDGGATAGGRSSGQAETAAPGAAPAGSADGAAPGATGGKVAGVSAKQMRISIIAGYSGVFGQIIKDLSDRGFGTWVADVNSKGGINGRKLVVIEVDNKDTVEGGIAACKEVQGNNSYFAFSMYGQGGADAAASDCLDKAGIPVINNLPSSFNARWKNVYTVAEAGIAAKPTASFIQNVLKRGDSKIGVFIEQDPVWRGAAKGFLAGMQAAGLKVVHTENVASTQSNFVSELSRMRSAGVDTAVMIVATPNAVGIPRDAKAIGYAPTFTGAIWPLDEFSKAGGASVQKDVRAIRHFASANSPGYAAFIKTAQKHGKEQNPSTMQAYIYGVGLLIQKALENAGPSPTREAFGPAVEKIVDYNNGLLGASFGPGVRRSTTLMWPVKCCNPDNTWMGIGPARKSF